MPECPYCEKWFRSNKGLRTHITKMHTSKDGLGNRMVNLLSFDPLGKMKRQEKRRQ